MSQVWRQIGIMNQEVSSSKLALNRLQEQTEAYVNGTFTTMDSMEGKVKAAIDLATFKMLIFFQLCKYSGGPNYGTNG